MIQINDKDYIAEGLARKVYYHPHNNDLCIKIGKPEVKKQHLYKEINFYFSRGHDASPDRSTFYSK